MKYILYATDNTSDVNTKLPTSPIDAHIDNLNPPLSQVDNIKNDIDTNNSAPSVPQIVNIDTTFANIIIDDNILKDEATQIKKFPIIKVADNISLNINTDSCVKYEYDNMNLYYYIGQDNTPMIKCYITLNKSNYTLPVLSVIEHKDDKSIFLATAQQTNQLLPLKEEINSYKQNIKVSIGDTYGSFHVSKQTFIYDGNLIINLFESNINAIIGILLTPQYKDDAIVSWKMEILAKISITKNQIVYPGIINISSYEIVVNKGLINCMNKDKNSINITNNISYTFHNNNIGTFYIHPNNDIQYNNNLHNIFMKKYGA